jgi:hypothetical protein
MKVWGLWFNQVKTFRSRQTVYLIAVEEHMSILHFKTFKFFLIVNEPMNNGLMVNSKV